MHKRDKIPILFWLKKKMFVLLLKLSCKHGASKQHKNYFDLVRCLTLLTTLQAFKPHFFVEGLMKQMPSVFRSVLLPTLGQPKFNAVWQKQIWCAAFFFHTLAASFLNIHTNTHNSETNTGSGIWNVPFWSQPFTKIWVIYKYTHTASIHPTHSYDMFQCQAHPLNQLIAY